MTSNLPYVNIHDTHNYMSLRSERFEMFPTGLPKFELATWSCRNYPSDQPMWNNTLQERNPTNPQRKLPNWGSGPWHGLQHAWCQWTCKPWQVNQQAWRKGSLTWRIFWYQGPRLAKKHRLPETNSLPLKNQLVGRWTFLSQIPYVSGY